VADTPACRKVYEVVRFLAYQRRPLFSYVEKVAFEEALCSESLRIGASGAGE